MSTDDIAAVQIFLGALIAFVFLAVPRWISGMRSARRIKLARRQEELDLTRRVTQAQDQQYMLYQVGAENLRRLEINRYHHDPQACRCARCRPVLYQIPRLTSREASEIKARELLMSNLSAQQLGEFESSGYFHVNAGRRTYRIYQGHAGNVALLDAQGKVVRRFCAYPPGVPAGDAMLAQKLLLETDEGAFLAKANAF